jgi:hydrogenase nickel incorporation protein HypA/HybF
MHEFSIAQKIVNLVLEEGEKHDARKVTEIELLIGEFNNIVPESLLFSMEVLSKGTIAEGAAVRIEKDPVKIACRGCGAEGAPADPLVFVCPACGSPGVEIRGGRALNVVGFSIEDGKGR